MPDRQAPDEGARATSIDEARAARATAEAALHRARAQDPTVREVAHSLRRHRGHNHFAELLQQTFKEHRT